MKLSDTARISLFIAVSAVLLAAVFAAAGIAIGSTSDVGGSVPTATVTAFGPTGRSLLIVCEGEVILVCPDGEEDPNPLLDMLRRRKIKSIRHLILFPGSSALLEQLSTVCEIVEIHRPEEGGFDDPAGQARITVEPVENGQWAAYIRYGETNLLFLSGDVGSEAARRLARETDCLLIPADGLRADTLSVLLQSGADQAVICESAGSPPDQTLLHALRDAGMDWIRTYGDAAVIQSDGRQLRLLPETPQL